jgi:HD-like signal output (HDOD) protein
MNTTLADSPEFALLQDIANELSRREVVFPTFVNVAMRIRELINDPDLNMARVAKMVAGDPLLAAKVIKLANSAAVNLAGDPITDLGHAVTRIGLDAVRNLMYAIAMIQLRSSKELVRYQELSKKLWMHSLQTAALARIIAKNCSRISPDKAMLAGLVHDIGAFYLLYRLAMSRHGLPEDELLPLIYQWHEGIGCAVLAALDHPEEITDAIKAHELPREVSAIRSLADVVYLANHYAGLDVSWYALPGEEPAQAETPTPFDQAECSLPEIIEESRAEIEEITAVFA